MTRSKEGRAAGAASLHAPVLRDLCVELLEPALQMPGAVLVDATLGMGGHSEAILQAVPTAKVIGIDRDPDAIAIATGRLAPFADRFRAIHGTFDRIGDLNVDALWEESSAEPGLRVTAILMDLGVSSLQLDRAERGFAYAQDGPLDMRMSQGEGPSAADLVNTADESELARILWEYGEERASRKLARAIVASREETPILTTSQLAEIVDKHMPAPARRRGGNPSKRTFQALRIAVNDELRLLETTLPAALRALPVGGRMVVESYHSLEDRMTKRVFAKGLARTGPPDLPVALPEHEPRLKALTRGAIKADEEEIQRNPRAKSVRLRAVEVLRGWESK